MSNNPRVPTFTELTRWLARKMAASAIAPPPQEPFLEAARQARDEFVSTPAAGATNPPELHLKSSRFEVLELLAAADREGAERPPELITGRGFRVTLSYDEGNAGEGSSICVLVQSPPDLVEEVQGEMAYLWNGAERFELGQFDRDGKAIGTLPAGIEITLSDFAMGKVKLEEPSPPTVE
jgi:hypothetical protein